MTKKLILASASPRRKEILEGMGLTFSICPAKGEENSTRQDPWGLVEELALRKARETAERTEEEALVIGSDTVVAVEGEQGLAVLGKPVDEADAFRMLKTLQGNTHTVYTGVAVVDARTGETLVHFVDKTEVSMYPMPDAWIHEYIKTGEPMDKAGGYAIQGGCALWIRGIRGEYATVVGFPAARFYQELRGAGIDLMEFCRQ